MNKRKFTKSSGNVFKDVGFDELEARNLKFRSYLMSILVKYIQDKGLNQKEAAEYLKVSQPRISNLMHGKIDLFSASMLLDMIERTGFPVYKKIETDIRQFFKKSQDHHSSSTRHNV